MQLFSKRNSPYSDDDAQIFHEDAPRRMILEQIKYISSSPGFLEHFILVQDEEKNQWRIHKKTLSDFSTRELGYDICSYFDTEKNVLKSDNDYYLFDLIEIIILFSKEDKREGIRARFEEIFIESNSRYTIHDFIIEQKAPSIHSNYALIKNNVLKRLFAKNYSFTSDLSYQELAKNSADIIQFLFSSSIAKETKTSSENVVDVVAKKWFPSGDITKQKEIHDHINNLVLNIKFLNNNISNIRHTDQWAVNAGTDLIYKFIYNHNISLAELVILAEPNKYFFDLNSEDLKSGYLIKYGLDKNSGWIIKKPMPTINEFDPHDIPF